jgi:hypothetical protein
MAQGREGVRDLCGQDSTAPRRLEDSSPPPLHHLRQATQPNPPQVCRLPVTSSDLPLPMRVGSRGRRGGGATPARWRDRRRRQPITAPSIRDASLLPRLASRAGTAATSTLRPQPPFLHLGRSAQLCLPPPPARRRRRHTRANKENEGWGIFAPPGRSRVFTHHHAHRIIVINTKAENSMHWKQIRKDE